MRSNERIVWAKRNSKIFIQDILGTRDIQRESAPTCIFMAGLPGSGKTEFTRRFVETSGIDFVRIDMDEIASKIDGYSPEKADEFRESATLLQNKLFDAVLKKKYNFIMDGTFRSKNSILGIKRAIKHGFSVKIIYIFQDPRVAWEFTCAREKVEHRAIEFQGFIQTYYEILENMKEIDNINNPNLSIDSVIKSKDNTVKQTLDNISMTSIDEFVNIEYNKDKLIKYVKND